MINDHCSLIIDHSKKAIRCATHLAAGGTNDRSDDKTDERLEELHPASRIRSAAADSRPLIDTVFRLPDCPAVIAIALRGRPSRAARNRMSSALAAPPAGGAATLILSASPCRPATAVVRARGTM